MVKASLKYGFYHVKAHVEDLLAMVAFRDRVISKVRDAVSDHHGCGFYFSVFNHFHDQVFLRLRSCVLLLHN